MSGCHVLPADLTSRQSFSHRLHGTKAHTITKTEIAAAGGAFEHRGAFSHATGSAITLIIVCIPLLMEALSRLYGDAHPPIRGDLMFFLGVGGM